MKEGRQAVKDGRSDVVLEALKALLPEDLEHSASSLTEQVMQHSQVKANTRKRRDDVQAETLKEALLTGICVGSRPLVEVILSLFYEHPEEEKTGARGRGQEGCRLR